VTRGSSATHPNLPDAVLVDGTAWREGLAGTPSALDRGLHFGDGLFETIACRGGRPRFAGLHLQRLTLGCERLGIALPPPTELRAEIELLAADREASLVKVIVTRGPATGRGYGARGDERPTRISLRYGWPPEDPRLQDEGVAVQLSEFRLGENAELAGLKHLSRLDLVLARRGLEAAGVDELLLFSSSGRLVSGSMTNVFLVEGGRLRTPRIDLCGVAGVMRRVVLRAAERAGLAVEEAALGREDLERAQEVFLTNARVGIWPVRRVHTRTLSPGPLTRRVQQLIAPSLEEATDG
jgi:4-amino-4-deoxychorismate lyase